MISDRPVTNETTARQLAIETAQTILHTDARLLQVADQIREWLLTGGPAPEMELRAWAVRQYLSDSSDPRGTEVDWLLRGARERYDYARGALTESS